MMQLNKIAQNNWLFSHPPASKEWFLHEHNVVTSFREVKPSVSIACRVSITMEACNIRANLTLSGA